LPRVSDHEQVAQSEVENDFGRQPGIRATKQRGERTLAISQRIPLIDILSRMCERSADKSTVTG
jgi:hypothetical protein